MAAAGVSDQRPARAVRQARRTEHLARSSVRSASAGRRYPALFEESGRVQRA
jgi:hypothetical protein